MSPLILWRRCALSALVVSSVRVVQAQTPDVTPLGCAASTIDGYDFQVTPAFGFVVRWGLSPDLETISFQAEIQAELPGWVAIGFSSDGLMIGSDAVVAFPSQGELTEYDLDSKVSLLNQPSTLQEITDTIVQKADGATSLAFTRPTTPVGEGKLSLLTGFNASVPVILIWAFGPSEDFSFHFEEGRGAVSVELSCPEASGSVADAPNDDDGAADPVVGTGFPMTMAPTPAPVTSVLSASPTIAPEGNSRETSGAPHSGMLFDFFGVGRRTGLAAITWSFVALVLAGDVLR